MIFQEIKTPQAMRGFWFFMDDIFYAYNAICFSVIIFLRLIKP